MGISSFSVGTRIRWQEKTFEIRPSTSVNIVTLREILTEEETSEEMQVLLKALFSKGLFFLPRGQAKKSRKQADPDLEENLRTLEDYAPYLAKIAGRLFGRMGTVASMQP